MNFEHEPLIPYMLNLHKFQRQLMPLHDFFLQNAYNMYPKPYDAVFSDQDSNDDWKDMLQRRMWNQFNSQPGRQMGVDGNMYPHLRQEPMRPMQMPVVGRRG